MPQGSEAHPVDLHVGKRIRERRQHVHMSQDQLAEKLGVSPQQVQKYERADTRISASRLHEVSTILKVPVAYFFAGTDQQEFEFFSAELAANVSNFLKSAEGQELAEIFPLLEDASVRRKMVDLIRAMTLGGQKSARL